MNANEPLGIELALERLHRRAHQMRLSAGVKTHVVALRIHPFDVRRRHEVQAFVRSNEKPLRVDALGVQALEHRSHRRVEARYVACVSTHASLDALQRTIESIAVDWLQ